MGPRGPQLFATTAVRLAELVLSVRFELIASRSLTRFLCKIYAFWPFWSSPSCTRYVSYVGLKENLLGLVLRFRKIRTEKYVFFFEKYIFFAWYFVSIFHVFFFNENKIVLSNSHSTWVFSTVLLGFMIIFVMDCNTSVYISSPAMFGLIFFLIFFSFRLLYCCDDVFLHCSVK